MTIWSAPDFEHLLDQHLRLARLELLADHRLHLRAEDDGGEDPGFVAELIVDKLEAAARAGFDAVEASLRASAAEHLRSKGLGVDAVRAGLEQSAERLVPPKRPRLERVERNAVPQGFYAGLVATALIILVFSLWTLGILGFPLYAVLTVASVGVSYALYRFLLSREAQLRRKLIDEWPARVARHYGDALREGVTYYEYVVRTLARGGVLIPWR